MPRNIRDEMFVRQQSVREIFVETVIRGLVEGEKQLKTFAIYMKCIESRNVQIVIYNSTSNPSRLLKKMVKSVIAVHQISSFA